MTSAERQRRGILIVDHGTRSAAANGRLADFARRIARARPDWLVGHAHMELAAPDFTTGLDGLVRAGASQILVQLHFLSTGYHVRESIPRLVAEARERHPGIEITMSEPLGEDDRLVGIVLERMDAALG